jgi:hypothetical protein
MPRVLIQDVIQRDALTPNEYFVQCMAHGLVGVALPGSELEKLCAQRADSGALDALCLNGGDECPKCRADEEREWAFYVDNVRDFEKPEERRLMPPWMEREHARMFDKMIDECADEDHEH